MALLPPEQGQRLLIHAFQCDAAFGEQRDDLLEIFGAMHFDHEMVSLIDPFLRAAEHPHLTAIDVDLDQRAEIAVGLGQPVERDDPLLQPEPDEEGPQLDGIGIIARFRPCLSFTRKAMTKAPTREKVSVDTRGPSPEAPTRQVAQRGRYISDTILARRRRMLDAAKQMIAEAGPDGFTIRDLSRRANVS
eukprot:gene16594-21999_t